MNRTLIISYDLVNPGRNYDDLIKKIKSHSSWCRLGGSAYLIYTDKEVKVVRDNLRAVMDSNDKLYVGVSPRPSAWAGMPDDVANWILKHQVV